MGQALSNYLATSRKRPNHIPALDGVRLIAVGLVILHHTTSGLHASFFLHLIGMQHDNGIGPPLFFVLSGTLLTTVILDARNAENRYRNFLLRRVLRIFPLYFGYLGLIAFATWIETGRLPSHLWVFALFSQNIFVYYAGHTGSVFHTYHLWTIAVQDQFYLVWPLLLWRCKSNRQMRLLCSAGIVLSFLSHAVLLYPGFPQEYAVRSLPAVAGCMCLGGLLALEGREKTILTPVLLKSLIPLLLVCALWMWHGLDFTSPLGSLVGYQLVALACAAAIAVALQPTSMIARVLGSKIFATGGKKYAFGMYMFHPFLLNFCVLLSIRSMAVRLALFFASTIVISGLSYRFYESPFLHMQVGRGKKRGSEAAAPVSTGTTFANPSLSS
jgi:peptidoglycan/LPS O-acetylase OafA/YrhL